MLTHYELKIILESLLENKKKYLKENKEYYKIHLDKIQNLILRFSQLIEEREHGCR